MNVAADASPMLTVGKVAAATGLTVRTLHHYEAVGLFSPDARTMAGHRLYGPLAMARLYRIQLLRRLGLSLAQIRNALDSPDWDLRRAFDHHRSDLTQTLTTAARLRTRLDQLLVSIGDGASPGPNDLIMILEDMHMLNSPVQQRISILVYQDLAKVYEHLTEVFELSPGEVTRDGLGTVVHAELYAGDGVLWLHPESDEFTLASPKTLGGTTATMAVLVDDVDEHHRRVVAAGGDIVYGPINQPYGFREYSARDCEGGFWSFMKPLDTAVTS